MRITVSDHGVGIAAEHLDHIFDPYFTTKQTGSGLGLATVHAIVINHDGHITVESQLGEGTTFEIHIPAEAGATSIVQSREEELLVGQGRILVMDDDEDIRELASTILGRLGYEVEFAEEGAEAVRLFREAVEESQEFACVILDLTAPTVT